MKLSPSQSEDKAPINNFNGHYQFLNNDHPAWVHLEGLLFPSAAIAYQAARTVDLNKRQQLADVEKYQQLKEISVSIPNPPDWSHKKYKVMEKLVRDKFKRNKELSSKLAATNPRKLVNTFREGSQVEQYWGVVEGKGFNALGKILMSIRQQILNGSDWEKWIADQGLENNPKMRPSVQLVVIKDKKSIDKLFLEKNNRFFFGTLPSSHYKLDHPSISKMHACIFIAQDCTVKLVDLGSSNGTTIIRDGVSTRLQHLKPVALQTGDEVCFGLSSRTYRAIIDDAAVREYLQGSLQKDKPNITNKEEFSSQKVERSRSRSRSRSPKKNRQRK